MEFKFNVNNILGDEITVVDNNLRPYRNNHSSAAYRSQLSTIIDDMGAASAKAQGLNGAITSGSKLAHSDHKLYIMRDTSNSNGNGSVVGILKVGCKKLFIYDHNGQQHEKEPLCVLDFYVHESKQRMGCGKKLFEGMLQAEQVKAAHLAIDRPSAKFASFLARHYGLKATINQVNNFVIFEGFFRDRPAEPSNRRRSGKPPVHTYRQNSTDTRWQQQQNESAGPRRGQSTSNVLAQHQAEKETLKNVMPRENASDIGDQFTSGKKSSLPASPVHRAMGAQNSMYSRHPEAGGNQPALDAVKPGTPPMLRRNGPSQDYLALSAAVNGHNYQDRRGHLIVDSNMKVQKETSKPPTTSAASPASGTSQVGNNSSWNVFGVPREATRSANPRYQQTRLW